MFWPRLPQEPETAQGEFLMALTWVAHRTILLSMPVRA